MLIVVGVVLVSAHHGTAAMGDRAVGETNHKRANPYYGSFPFIFAVGLGAGRRVEVAP